MARQNGNGETATRSLFSFGLLGLLNAIILVSPLDAEMQAKLAATLNPTVALGAYVLYRLWDRWDRKGG